jgi:membrane protease YdiL (CAAX protease family)
MRKNEIVSFAQLGYAGRMLWKKPWQPEVVLMLIGGIVLAFFTVSLAVGMLQHYKVTGFQNSYDVGAVLAATLCFHGAVIIGAGLFLKFHALDWREVLGLNNERWKRSLLFAGGVLLLMLPVMLGLKYVSEITFEKMGWPTEDQKAVELFTHVKSVGLKIYLGVFAVVIAPIAEEFIFRGLLFSAAKKMGWPRLAWVGVSLLFALIHFNGPTFLPLFVFALGLTWLYQKTEGLLAPIAAHCAFNAVNVILLLLAEEFARQLPNQS